LSAQAGRAAYGCQAERQERVEKAVAESELLIGIFNALLRISGIESSGVSKQLVDVDVAELLEDIVDMFEPLADEKGVALETRIDAGTTVLGDRNLLFQAMENIIENAIKYSPAGGRVFVQVHHSAEAVNIEVQDSGPGIPEAFIEKVFERFYRLEEHRGSPGSGLGLSLVKAVADLHGAEIALDNREGGLCFSIRF